MPVICRTSVFAVTVVIEAAVALVVLGRSLPDPIASNGLPLVAAPVMRRMYPPMYTALAAPLNV